MVLVNEMFESPNNHMCYLGVCIKKAYNYYEYIQTTTGCTCNESFVGEIIKYLNSGLYVESFQNTNPNYQIDHEDNLTCLVIDIPIVDWVENYVNSLATTGYTGSTTSDIEDRVIYDNSGDLNDGLYFKLNTIINSGCTIDTTPMWAIIDNVTGEIWKSGGTTNYWYYELDDCGNNTCNRIVISKDINPNSDTYGQTVSVYRCGELPTVTTTPISGNIDNVIVTGGNVISDGNSEILSRGICWDVYGETPTINDHVNFETGTTGLFTSIITNLERNKIYHIRAFATNCFGTAYGEEIKISTEVICNLAISFTGQTSHGTSADGTLTAIVSGGTEPYSYLWSNGQLTQTATGLTGNSVYGVAVTSHDGCTISGITTTPECDCASGYTYVPTTDMCRTTTDAMNSGTSYAAKHYQYTTYSMKGMIFYKQDNYNVNGTWDITKTALLPNAYLTTNQNVLPNVNNYSMNNNLWVNQGHLTGVDYGRLNKTGVWVSTNSSQEGIFGFTQGFTVPSNDIYYVGFGSDNTGKIEIDGKTIVDQDIQQMYLSSYFNTTSGNADRIPYWFWFMYPVELAAGVTHSITISANNSGSLGILGCEIYKATEAQLVGCTTNSGTGPTSLSQYIVFSTAPKTTFAEKPNVGVNDGDQFQLGNWTCPIGYQLSYDNGYFCERSIPIVCP